MRFAKLIIAVWLALTVSGRQPAQQAQPPAPPPAVGVQPTQMNGITPSNAFVGRVKAVDTGQLRAHVKGFLKKVLFKEGRRVKTGKLI